MSWDGVPGAPERITLIADDYHAEYVGRTADGRQFFLTTPFVPGRAEYIALYTWDAEGEFLGAQIEPMGSRDSLDHEAREAKQDALLAGLGDFELGEISVAPFAVDFDGEQFGLVPQLVEDMVWVNALPGDHMAFFEPWDSGEYDT